MAGERSAAVPWPVGPNGDEGRFGGESPARGDIKDAQTGARWAARNRKGMKYAVTCTKARSYSAPAASLKVSSSAIPDILILVLVSGCRVRRLRSLMASRQFIEFTAKDCWPLGSRQATAGMGHEQLSSPQGVSGRSRFRSRSFGRAPQPPGAFSGADQLGFCIRLSSAAAR